MKKLLVCCVAVIAFAGLARADLWINEFHYDNTGTDVGEFVEVVLAPGEATPLANITVSLYNGSNGLVYDSQTLDNFVLGTPSNGYNFYTWNPTSIQNGPDAIALDISGTIVTSGTTAQFLSYEGTFVGAGGPANGLTSTDVGVSEGGGTPVGASIALTGSGSTYDNFTWVNDSNNTAGALNNNQTLTAIPEPSTFALIGLTMVGLLGARRKMRG